jgi:hypothetical protein
MCVRNPDVRLCRTRQKEKIESFVAASVVLAELAFLLHYILETCAGKLVVNDYLPADEIELYAGTRVCELQPHELIHEKVMGKAVHGPLAFDIVRALTFPLFLPSVRVCSGVFCEYGPHRYRHNPLLLLPRNVFPTDPASCFSTSVRGVVVD